MSWNYRVLKRKYDNNITEFAIYEVYYDENGVPSSCSEDPVLPFGRTQADLEKDLTQYMEALKEPCLDWHSF